MVEKRVADNIRGPVPGEAGVAADGVAAVE